MCVCVSVFALVCVCQCVCVCVCARVCVGRLLVKMRVEIRLVELL